MPILKSLAFAAPLAPLSPSWTTTALALIVARLGLAAVFAAAGFAKLHDLRGSKKALGDFGVPPAWTPILAVLLPVTEVACAVALVRGEWAQRGAVVAAGLLAVFCAAIAVNLGRGRAPVCRCFGQVSSLPISRGTLLRNLALLSVAGMVAWTSDDIPFSWPQYSGHLFETAAITLVGLLAVLVGVLLWFSFHILAQNGGLMLRLEAVEAHLHMPPQSAPVEGLPLGQLAPAFDLYAVDGGTRNLYALEESHTTVMLVFTDPACGACEALLPDLVLWQRAYVDRLSIVPVTRGETEQIRAQSKARGLYNVLVQLDREVSQAYLVTAIPSAVLVVEGKIASSIAAGPDAIRALVARVGRERMRSGESTSLVLDVAGTKLQPVAKV